MVGVYIRMGARFGARAVVAAIAASAVCALAGATPALAAPMVSISSPATGAFTNESSLTLSGTSSDSTDQVTVNIYSGSSAEGTPVQSPKATPAASGEWSVQASSLADGAYTAVAEQTELLETGKSSAVRFTIDTVEPKVTLEPVSSPTATTPTLEGEAGHEADDEPTVTVTVFKGSLPKGTVAASGSAPVSAGAWTYTPPTLADGTYTAQASQHDAAGNVGHSSARTFIVKSAAPTVTLKPVPTPANNPAPTLEGSASSAEGDEQTVNVTIYEGNSAAGTVAASGSVQVNAGSWKYTPSQLADGTYTAQATQGDKAGNTGKSSPRTFTIDTVAPAVTIKSVSSPTSNPTPTLAGAAGTAPDDEGVAVTVYKGSSVGGSVASSGAATLSSSTWSYTPSHLNDGTYTAQAVQRDEASNVGKAATTFTVKAGKPVVTLNQPATPSNNASPTLSGTGDASEGNIQSVTVNVYSGSEVSGSPAHTVTTGVGSGSWSSGPIELADGTYTAQAEQKDEAGNTGVSAARTFTIDTVTPSVAINSMPPVTGNPAPTLKGSRETAPDLKPVLVKIYNGGSPGGNVASEGAAAPSGASWSYTPGSNLADGTYTAQATEEDTAGNVGKSNAVTFTVKTSKPVVTLNQPPELSNNGSPSFSGGADTGEGDVPTVTVKVYSGGEVSGSPVRTASTVASGGTWSAGPVELSDGTYTAQAEQKDEAGNTGTSSPRTFTIDRTPPAVTLSAPSAWTNNPTPTLKGARGTAPKDDAAVSVKVHEGSSVGGGVVAESSFGVSGSSWSYTTTHLNDGTYTAQAEQKDQAGNTGKSEEVTFNVDTVAPEVTVNSVASLSNNATPKLTGTASGASDDSANVNVTIYQGSSAPGPIAATGPATRSGTSWSLTSSHLEDGTYTAQVTQKDLAGNVGTSGTTTFTINTASPKVTLNSPAPRSNETTPSFSGTATDSTEVTVKVYKGKATSGTPAASASGPVSGGNWTTGEASPPLTNGEYTAVATQTSSLGNPAGKSSPATFIVNTQAPEVTLNKPPSPSNNLTPSFSGTASDTTPVTIKIYEGEHPTGTVVSEAAATPSGEAWSSGPVSKPLNTGKRTYTAVASEISSLKGNPEGTSVPVTFIIDTTPPTVTLNAQPKPRSNNASPTFTGAASDTSSVTISIYKGKAPTGPVVTTATATPSGGVYTSAPTTAPLAEGEYAAVATQPSSLPGNPEGKSSATTFVIDTKAPALTVTPFHAGCGTPTTPCAINTPLPELNGVLGTEAGDVPKVAVKIYSGTAATGTPVLSGEGTVVSGKAASWSFKSTNLADGVYTAQAEQKDEAENVGSSTSTFTIDTVAPAVTLNQPSPRSNNRAPVFTGTSSDTTPVTIRIYKEHGSEVVSETTASPAAGAWTSLAANKPELPKEKGKREYTAAATQTDEAGNSTTTARVKFVIDTEAPTLTLNQPPARTNNRTASFSGRTTDTAPVTVDIYEYGQPTGECEKPSVPIATATGGGTGESWSSSPISHALPDGRYTAIALQTSAFGNHCADSTPATFIVDTVAPHVSIAYPSNGSSSSGESQLVSGSADTGEGDGSHVSVQLYAGESAGRGQAPLQTAPVNASNGSWSTTFTGLAAGTYTALALQTDEAGNTGASAPVTFHLSGPATPAGRPAAAFSWYPPSPHAGERVSLVSGSTDSTSPLTGFAWDVQGNGAFQFGAQTIATTFPTPGNHLVRLRVNDASGASSMAAQVIPVGAPAAPLMRPFPLVRVLTTRTGSGIKFRLISVLAAPGARITITCKGHGCPLKRQSKTAAGKVGLASVSFSRFQRLLPTGTTLEIRVYKPGEIGKYTSLSVRRSGLRRVDECLAPDGRKPMPCPTG